MFFQEYFILPDFFFEISLPFPITTEISLVDIFWTYTFVLLSLELIVYLVKFTKFG
jgi:hypothetical protein